MVEEIKKKCLESIKKRHENKIPGLEQLINVLLPKCLHSIVVDYCIGTEYLTICYSIGLEVDAYKYYSDLIHYGNNFKPDMILGEHYIRDNHNNEPINKNGPLEIFLDKIDIKNFKSNADGMFILGLRISNVLVLEKDKNIYKFPRGLEILSSVKVISQSIKYIIEKWCNNDEEYLDILHDALKYFREKYMMEY